MPSDRLLLLLLLLLLSAFLIPCRCDGPLRAEEGGGLPSPHEEDNGIPARGDSPVAGWPATRVIQTPSPRIAEPLFALKVFAMDSVSRQPLAGASVDVYVNHTLWSSARAGDQGDVLLRPPYSPELSLTLLASMEGYVPTQLPWRTLKRPIFSRVTMQLLPHSQGNIWLFEDSVLIAGKTPDSSSQPSIKFPKNLLTLSEMTNVSSVTAYLTVPQRNLARDCVNCTQGIISSSSSSGNKSVYRNIELRPVAAISALLYAGGAELQVRGPIQISLPLGHPANLRPSDTVPAWAFNVNAGAWENQGLGIVKMVNKRLVWTYTASHLGYWIAAPLPSSNDYMGHANSWDFISFHTYLLVGILGGTLVVVIGFLCVLLCHCGGSYQEPRRTRTRRRGRFTKLAAVKKDQTTSIHMEEGGLLFHAGERGVQCEPSSGPSRHRANYNIYVEDPGGRPVGPLYENASSERAKGPQPHYVNDDEVARIRETSGRRRADMSSALFFQDKLVHIYNQPLAVLQATELFGAQEQPASGCKAATFPRSDPHSEAPNKDGYAKTLPKAPTESSPQRGNQDEPQALKTPPPGQGPNGVAWGRYNNLLESSVSVPGTLNEAAGVAGELQGISERTLLELARGKSSSSSSSHPRAWFVSLDGKPAAQVRHSIIELQGRQRPHSSNDTSLDSGVDMNEPQQSLREAARNRPRARASSSLPCRGRGRWGGEEQQQDLSSSESGTTATCTPEDSSLRSILDGGSSGAIPNIPEERDGTDSESRGTPPPRRPRKVREKGRAEKRSGKNVREGRPLTKQS